MSVLILVDLFVSTHCALPVSRRHFFRNSKANLLKKLVVFFLFQLFGIQNSGDRATLKKKIKDLRTAVEKERRQQDKEQKARDKLMGNTGGLKKKKTGLFGK